MQLKTVCLRGCVSCAVTHATPASFVAHQPSRKMEEEIAVDFVNSDLSVFIGGGKKYFDSRSDNENLLDKLSAKGFQIAFNLDDIKKVGSGKFGRFGSRRTSGSLS
jgi:alkaline phosphatase